MWPNTQTERMISTHLLQILIPAWEDYSLYISTQNTELIVSHFINIQK